MQCCLGSRLTYANGSREMLVALVLGREFKYVLQFEQAWLYCEYGVGVNLRWWFGEDDGCDVEVGRRREVAERTNAVIVEEK